MMTSTAMAALVCVLGTVQPVSAQEVHEDAARIRFGVDGGLGLGLYAQDDATAAFGALGTAGRTVSSSTPSWDSTTRRADG
jgi:uncharacterized membrane protein